MGGFLSGLGNFVGTAGPIAAQIGGDYEQAQAQGSGQRNQQALQMLALQRQQRAQEIENALNISKTGEQNALTAVHQHEAQKLQPGDAGYVPLMGAVAGAEAAAKWKTMQLQLDAEHQNRLNEIQQEGGNALAVAQENARDASARQTAQQTFTATQNDLNRKAEASRATSSANAASGRITQTQGAEIVPAIVHGVQAVGHAINPANWFAAPAPSGTPSPSTAPNPQQSAWDSAAQHLQKTQPNIDPSVVLGARP